MTPDPPDLRVGAIGLGQIGGGVARALAAQGRTLAVHDASPGAHGRLGLESPDAGSPAGVADRSDVVLVAVVDDAQVREVIAAQDGILSADARPTTIVILSTVSLETLDWAVEAAAKHGVDVLDCGVSGGPEAAAEGKLVCLVGGRRETFEQTLPVLEQFSALVVYFGGSGAGIKAKLARNLITYGGWLIAWEAAGLLGWDPDSVSMLADVVRASDVATGGAMQLVAHGVGLAGRPETDAGIPRELREHGAALAHKDLAAALALAATLGLELPAARLADRRVEEILGLDRDERTAGRPKGGA